MLTPRGWWFLVFTLSALALVVLYGMTSLILLNLTALLWFFSEWLLFAIRSRFVARQLRVVREVRDERGPVTSLWAGRTFHVRAQLHLDGTGTLPYVRATDRVPFAVGHVAGETAADGAVAPEHPLELSYRIHCTAPGRARFEGLGVQLADLQGFFYHTLHVAGVVEYRILPPLADVEGRAATVKRHNLLPSPGLHRHPRPGTGSELLDLRDYLPGDPPKTIAWKVSARRDRLITKEFESEVPIRCTLFVDTSQSVRVGPPGKNALARLVEIAAAVAQATAGARDLSGLCVFDEEGVRAYVRPARSPRHVIGLLHVLADAAALAPATGRADVAALVPLAHAFAEEVYPHLLRPNLNHVPVWLPWLRPKPAFTVPHPTLADRLYGRLPFLLLGLAGAGLLASAVAAYLLVLVLNQTEMPPWLSGGFVGLGWLLGIALVQRYLFLRRRQQHRWRKRLAALLSVRHGLVPGGLALLLEDDPAFSLHMQRFLAEHHVPYPLPYYDADGRYLFASAGKVDVLARALLRAVGKGRDNELFVLLVDLLELTDEMRPLLRAIQVALARHHQVMVLCPWPPGVPLPEAPRLEFAWPAAGHWPPAAVVDRTEEYRLHHAFLRLRRTLARLGVPVVCAPRSDSVALILDRLNRLRVQGRRR
jgi:uncharacterized protein (DUF58 family)